jgi:hypothetical protein
VKADVGACRCFGRPDGFAGPSWRKKVVRGATARESASQLRGLTRRFFLGRQRFELFSRNQRNQRAERKTLARKSSVLKVLGLVPWAFAASDRGRSSIYFPITLHGGGGGQKSGIFKRGPCGSTARISAKFRKLFYSVFNADLATARAGCVARNVAKFRVGGSSGGDVTKECDP